MENAIPKLSQASKMPCKSWSLPAWDTCPGARNDDGTPVDACSMCYALQGRYTFGVVKAVREHNLTDWEKPGWVDAMISHIVKSQYFRWFDSGDVYSPKLAALIGAVIGGTPNCRHWLPTRAYKDPEISFVLGAIEMLPNVIVRRSSDSITGERIKGNHTSTIIPDPTHYTPEKGAVLCTAYKRKGKCGPCRACWSSKIHTTIYPLHGKPVKEKQFA